MTLNLGTTCSDPEGLTPLTYELKLNNTVFGSSPNHAWFTFSSGILTYVHTLNSRGGDHAFEFKCTDNFGQTSGVDSFVIDGEQDYPPNVIAGIQFPISIQNIVTSYTLPAFSTLFSEPESQALTYVVTITDSSGSTRVTNNNNVLTLNLGTDLTSFTVSVKAKETSGY